MNCTNCGAPLPQGVSYCPTCGTPTPTYYSSAGSAPNAPTAASSPVGPPTPLLPTDYGRPPYGVAPPSPYDPYNAPPLIPPPPPPERRGNRMGLLFLAILLAVIVVVGGVVVLLRPGSKGPSPTVNVTATAQAQAAATAHAQATATAAAVNPYTHSGTLALFDPLKDNSKGYNWDENTNCAFKNGTYHAIAPNPQYYDYCIGYASFSNFAYQVQMQILQGNGGGIDFRVKSTSVNQYYHLSVYGNGYYKLDVTNQTDSLFASGISSAIKQGLNQINVIGVVAQGASITVYINDQRVASANDSTYTFGQIGVEADPFGLNGSTDGKPTEVAFSNAKVWTL